MLYKIDTTIRQYTSRLYRTILVLLSAYIFYSFNNSLNNYVYYISSLSYIALYVSLYRSEDLWTRFGSISRIVTDYIYIFIFIYNKNINDPLLLSFTLLPIINSPNHTGKKRSYLIYGLLLAALVFSQMRFNDPHLYLVAVVFGILGTIDYLRTSFSNLLRDIERLVYEHSGKEIHLNNTYEIYTDIIDKISTSKLDIIFPVKNICCFNLNKKTPILINSSDISLSIEILSVDEMINTIETDGICYNVKAHLNKEAVNANCVVKTTGELIDYYFLFIFTKNQNKSISKIFTTKLLTPILERITRVLDIEIKLSEERDDYLRKIKTKIEFINRATLAMHFLRNKFGPIRGYFDLERAISSESDQEKASELRLLSDKEKSTAMKTVPIILERINLILEKGNNPFIVAELTSHSMAKIVRSVKSIWDNNFIDGKLEINFDIDKLRTNLHSNINEEYFDIVITDIIINMTKYSEGKNLLRISEFRNDFTFSFCNRVNIDDSNYQKLRQIVDDFNSGDIIEIFRRKTFGIYFIKTILDQMSILSKMNLDRDILTLTITVKGLQ